jgi:subfamily B ATP-binding cassette protein MsbA
MKTDFKHNFGGYFFFYYRVLGLKLLFDIFLSVAVSFLDGFSLAMFIPLIQSMDSTGHLENNKSMGKLHFFTDSFNYLSIPLNIYTVLVALAVLFAIKGAVKFGQLVSQTNLKQVFMKKARYELTNGLQQLSYESFLKLDAGKVHNIVTTEVSKLLTAITQYLLSISGVAMLITYVAMAFLANWQFAFLVVVGSALSNLLFRKIFQMVKKASISISNKGNVFNSYLIEAIHYFKYLKATNNFRGFSKKIKLLIDETESLNKKIGYLQAVTTSIREPLVMVIVIIVIIVQIKWMGGGLGSIILSLLLFYRGLSFLMMFQASWQSFMQNVGAIDLVFHLTNEMHQNKEVQSDVELHGFKEGIVTQDLSFSFGDNKVLQNLNIVIEKNKTIALVGESGSGKTTLANVITALLKPASGNLLIDGVPISNYNLDSYRNRIGYISQEAVIFRDDIYNNITFWAEPTEENMKRFWNVIEMASLTNFLDSLPEKEKTSLGDNGMLISGGQKQRISIARELFKATDILILDEATSALDSETELFIQQNIEKLHGTYTMVIIAHRLSTIRNVDNIYMLDRGKVTASGTFDEMLERSPRFSRMVELQKI